MSTITIYLNYAANGAKSTIDVKVKDLYGDPDEVPYTVTDSVPLPIDIESTAVGGKIEWYAADDNPPTIHTVPNLTATNQNVPVYRGATPPRVRGKGNAKPKARSKPKRRGK